MAITTTNARYEGFIFDGENSRTYGVYVTDVEVFGAPVRNVEMISIPGRNGSFALDKGSYENIQVTYKCAMGCESQADFNAGISAFRNMLASRTGYKRLEDEINTSEYRMACFRGGISVPTLNKETATFDVVFDCKPQRYLKSGETAVSVANGGTISNPTLYDASPLLHASGYGIIHMGDSDIQIFQPRPLGTITIYDNTISVNTLGFTIPVSPTQFNNGDTFTFTSASIPFEHYYSNPRQTRDVSITTNNPLFQADSPTSVSASYTRFIAKTTAPIEFAIGTAKTESVTFTVAVGGSVPATTTFTISISYDPAHNLIDIEQATEEDALFYGQFNALVVGDSSVIITSDYYIDLDIGEAWQEDSGEIIPANNAVAIPAKLPVLVPGTNAVTYDNTITQLTITPRWWQL